MLLWKQNVLIRFLYRLIKLFVTMENGLRVKKLNVKNWFYERVYFEKNKEKVNTIFFQQVRANLFVLNCYSLKLFAIFETLVCLSRIAILAFPIRIFFYSTVHYKIAFKFILQSIWQRQYLTCYWTWVNCSNNISEKNFFNIQTILDPNTFVVVRRNHFYIPGENAKEVIPGF